jgi:hypothetical protein
VPFAEGLFAALFWVIGLALLVVFGMALWIGKGAKGKLIGFIVACGICSPILWPLAQSTFEGVRRDRLKTDVIPICQRELQQTPGPFVIDGFVDETGGLRSKDIQYFLVDAGLAFVEVKLTDDGKLTGPEDYPWMVSQRGGYARLQLDAQGQGNCYVPPHRKVEGFFTSMAPVRPGTCLVVTFSDRPSARHQVALDSGSSTSTRSRWVLRNLSNGTEVAGFTDASKALSPHAPWFDVNESDCRPNGTSGYSTLMRRVQASPEARAHTRQHVLDRGAVAVVGLPATIAELEAQRKANSFPTLRSSDGPYAGDSAEVLDRRPWKDAYALAQQHDAWVQHQALIRPAHNSLQQITHNGLYGAWGTTGEHLVFVQANGSSDRVAIFGVSFEGRTLWAGQLAPLSPWTDSATLQFVPERFELAEEALLVHGIFGHSVGEENRKPWTVRIPRVGLARLFAGLPPTRPITRD